jgi:transcriptional regulator with XRE-family HTH domain
MTNHNSLPPRQQERMRTIGAAILSIRKAHGESPIVFADRHGVNYRTLLDYEHGKEPRLHILEKFYDDARRHNYKEAAATIREYMHVGVGRPELLDLIENIRYHLSITRQDIALHIGVRVDYIRQWETGRTAFPPQDVVARIRQLAEKAGQIPAFNAVVRKYTPADQRPDPPTVRFLFESAPSVASDRPEWRVRAREAFDRYLAGHEVDVDIHNECWTEPATKP